MGYSKRARKRFVDEVIAGDLPPWRLIRSRRLAKLLGVSLQSLANWRMRETGPSPAPRPRKGGNRTYYRLDEAVAWASGWRLEPWEVSRDWLARRELAVEPSTQTSTEFLITSIDQFIPKV